VRAQERKSHRAFVFGEKFRTTLDVVWVQQEPGETEENAVEADKKRKLQTEVFFIFSPRPRNSLGEKNITKRMMSEFYS